MSSLTFNPVTYGNLSFTNILVTETDVGTVQSFTAMPGTILGGPGAAGPSLDWAAVRAAVYYAGSSETLNFNYTVSAGSGSLIDSVGQLYTADILTGPGVHLTAVENVYDTSGNLLGTGTFTQGVINPTSVQLSQAAQVVNVQITLSLSIDGTGSSASEVKISAIQQSFGTIAAPPPPPATASIGDIVFFDATGSGLESSFNAGPGIAGVTVDLLNNAGSVIGVTTTDASGLYHFTGLTAGVYQVEFFAPNGYNFTTQGVGSNPGINSSANQATGITAPITLTAGEVNNNVEAGLVVTSGGSGLGQPASLGSIVFMDTNRDGVFDNGETLVGGVTVSLLDGIGNSVLATTTTDSTGHYQFTNLAPGAYEVQFTAPTGDIFTTQTVGSNPFDYSSPNASTGITAPVTLTAGQVDNNVNAGLQVPPAQLGSYVFLDGNADGVFDNGESTVAGVTIQLLDGTGSSILATTTTDSSGHYAFTNLNPGTYEEKFVAPNGDIFTTQAVGSNPYLSSSPNATTGLTGPITLTAGQIDNNVNAGLQPLGAIGNTVWLDTNKDGLIDNGETNVVGVTVELLNGTGTSVLSVTTTNASGLYEFTGLAAGVYEVKFVAPSGDSFTTQGVGSNPALNSSPNPTTGVTAPITLAPGQIDNNVEAGLITNSPPPTSGISVLKVPCSVVVNPYGQISYSFFVTNTGGQALSNVNIVDNIGTAANPHYVAPSLVTTGTNGILNPGQTWVYTETITQGGSWNGGWGTSGDQSGSSCGSGSGASGGGCDSGSGSSGDHSGSGSGSSDGGSCGGGSGSSGDHSGSGSASGSSGDHSGSGSGSSDGSTCGSGSGHSGDHAGNDRTSGSFGDHSGNGSWGNGSGSMGGGSDGSWGGGSGSMGGSSGGSWGRGSGSMGGSSSGSWGGGSGSMGGGSDGSWGGRSGSMGGGSDGSWGSGSGSMGGSSDGSWGGRSGSMGGGSDGSWGRGSSSMGGGSGGSWGRGSGSMGGSSGGSWGGGSGSMGGGSGGSWGGGSGSMGGSSGGSWGSGSGSMGGSSDGSWGNGSGSMGGGSDGSWGNGSGSMGGSSDGSWGSGSGSSGDHSGSGRSGSGSSGDHSGSGSGASDGSSCGSGSGSSGDHSGSGSGSGSSGDHSGSGSGASDGSSCGSGSGSSGDHSGSGGSGSGSSGDHSGSGSGASDGSYCGSGSGSGSSGDHSGSGSGSGSSGDHSGSGSGASDGSYCGSGSGSSGDHSGSGSGSGTPSTAPSLGLADTVTVTATAGSGTVTATDIKEVILLNGTCGISVNGPTPSGSLSTLYGTPQTLEFLYNPGNTVSLMQNQPGMASVSGTNTAATAYMVIENQSGSSIYFEGAVQAGERVLADATLNPLTNTPIANGHFDTTAGADIFALVYSSQQAFLSGGAAQQTIAYNASGSQAMHLNDTIGSLQLVGYIGSQGGHLTT